MTITTKTGAKKLYKVFVANPDDDAIRETATRLNIILGYKTNRIDCCMHVNRKSMASAYKYFLKAVAQAVADGALDKKVAEFATFADDAESLTILMDGKQYFEAYDNIDNEFAYGIDDNGDGDFYFWFWTVINHTEAESVNPNRFTADVYFYRPDENGGDRWSGSKAQNFATAKDAADWIIKFAAEHYEYEIRDATTIRDGYKFKTYWLTDADINAINADPFVKTTRQAYALKDKIARDAKASDVSNVFDLLPDIDDLNDIESDWQYWQGIYRQIKREQGDFATKIGDTTVTFRDWQVVEIYDGFTSYKVVNGKRQYRISGRLVSRNEFEEYVLYGTDDKPAPQPTGIYDDIINTPVRRIEELADAYLLNDALDALLKPPINEPPRVPQVAEWQDPHQYGTPGNLEHVRRTDITEFNAHIGDDFVYYIYGKFDCVHSRKYGAYYEIVDGEPRFWTNPYHLNSDKFDFRDADRWDPDDWFDIMVKRGACVIGERADEFNKQLDELTAAAKAAHDAEDAARRQRDIAEDAYNKAMNNWHEARWQSRDAEDAIEKFLADKAKELRDHLLDADIFDANIAIVAQDGKRFDKHNLGQIWIDFTPEKVAAAIERLRTAIADAATEFTFPTVDEFNQPPVSDWRVVRTNHNPRTVNLTAQIRTRANA